MHFPTAAEIWGLVLNRHSTKFENPIHTDGEPFRLFSADRQLESGKGFSLPEATSGFAFVGAGEDGAVVFTKENGSVEVISSTSGVNGDDANIRIGDLSDGDAVQVANLSDEAIQLKAFYFFHNS